MPAPPRRRWFRLAFSLRTLLAFVALLAIGIALLAQQRRQSHRELQIVAALGNEVEECKCAGLFDSQLPLRFGCFGIVEQQQPWWRQRLGDVLGPRVRELSFVRLQSGGLTTVAGLTSLRALDLYQSQESDLSPIANLVGLEKLYLNGARVRDVGPLARLMNLKILDLDNTLINDVTPLTALTSLRILHLPGSMQVSDEQVAALQQALPNCEIERKARN